MRMAGASRWPALLLVLWVAAGWGKGGGVGTAVDPPASPADQFDARLAALDPAQPEGYFLLAEEVADSAANDSGRDLARRLYVLAYELDKARPPSPGKGRLGPSVCLGLVAIADKEDERRWLLALAQSMDDRQAGPDWSPTVPAAGADEVAFNLATVLGLSRAGEGRKAEKLLEKPGVSALLEKYDAALRVRGIGGGAGAVRRAIRDWPMCPECRNHRVVLKPGGGPEHGMVLCPTCHGNPGPRLSDEELAQQLQVESALLKGNHRSWAAQVLSDGGAPLRDLDTAEIAATYGVDPSRPVWRHGAWEAPEAPANKPPAAPGAGEARKP